MRTLSARILLGFVALTITFSVFAANLVWNLREIEDQASLILKGYVPIALAAAGLKQRTDDLRSYLDQGITDASGTKDIIAAVNQRRRPRDEALTQILTGGSGLGSLVSSDGAAAAELQRLMPATVKDAADLKRLVDAVAPLYGTLLAAPPLHVPGKTDASFQSVYDALDAEHRRACDALIQLRDQERSISTLIGNMQRRSASIARQNKDWLADNERTILIRAVYLGLAALVLGLGVPAWFAVMLRPLRRLREGARRIAAGEYDKRIPETGPSEIADLAREFNSMGRAVQEREAEKLRAARIAIAGKMAGQVAHEVRNPLSSIGLNTELLEEDLGEDATEARELCRKIRREVDRLTHITEIYLGLRGGKPKLARESVNTIVNDLVGFVRQDLGNRSVELDADLDADDPHANVDGNQIRQCLINLVRNAADAVSASGGGSVVVRTRGERNRVEISVEDDGVGITGEQLPRLFEPFFSTKQGGTGLGLALTQQIVQDHGGEIRVESRVGRGTTFTLSVPSA